MIGGGFLGQMHDTMKKNRDMARAALGKVKRKPFDNGEYNPSGNLILRDKKKLSENDRAILIAKVKRSNAIDLNKRIVVLIITLSILSFLIWGLPLFLNFLFNYR